MSKGTFNKRRTLDMEAVDLTRSLASVNCDPEKIDQIAIILNILVRLYSPLKIVLFGSQATGTWKKDSDIDFLVVGFNPEVEMGQYHEDAFKEGVNVPFDVVLATEQRVNEMKNSPSSVYAKALSEGVVIYVKKP